jgi:uncharacterized coiled-coil protein SlyX
LCEFYQQFSGEPKSTLDDRLFNLESQFADQMNVIKTMLLNMEERIGDVDGNVKKIKSKKNKYTKRLCKSDFSSVNFYLYIFY